MAVQSPQAGFDARSSPNNTAIEPQHPEQRHQDDYTARSDSGSEVEPESEAISSETDSEPDYEPHAQGSDADSDSEFEKRGKHNSGRAVWTTLEHRGLYFPPEYKPHRPLPRTARLLYNGKAVDLPLEAEEIAYAYAKVKDEWYGKRSRFKANFFSDLNAELVRCGRRQLQEFAKCDFGPMYAHYRKHEVKSAAALKNRARAAENYRWCWVDGEQLEVLYYMMEPPGLFVGRHRGMQKWGRFVRRIRPEEITINISPEYKDAVTAPFGEWKGVICDRTRLWLAKYEHPLLGLRYVRLAGHHRWRGWQREFQVARDLGGYLWRVRADYQKDLRSTRVVKREAATLLWLVDMLGLLLRITHSHPKFDHDIGLASLTRNRLILSEPATVQVRLVGPNGIVYAKTMTASPLIYGNLRHFMAGKEPEEPLFSKGGLKAAKERLVGYRRALTATAFRAYSFSRAFQVALDEYEANVIYRYIPRSRVARTEVFQQLYRKICSVIKMIPQAPTDRDDESPRIGLYRWSIFRLKMKLHALDPAFDVGETMDVDTYRRLGYRYAQEIEERFSHTLKVEIDEETATGAVQLATNLTIPNVPAYVWDLIYDKMLLIDIERVRIVCPEYNIDVLRERILDPRICVAYAKRHNVAIPKLVRNSIRTHWAFETPADFHY